MVGRMGKFSSQLTCPFIEQCVLESDFHTNAYFAYMEECSLTSVTSVAPAWYYFSASRRFLIDDKHALAFSHIFHMHIQSADYPMYVAWVSLSLYYTLLILICVKSSVHLSDLTLTSVVYFSFCILFSSCTRGSFLGAVRGTYRLLFAYMCFGFAYTLVLWIFHTDCD